LTKDLSKLKIYKKHFCRKRSYFSFHKIALFEKCARFYFKLPKRNTVYQCWRCNVIKHILHIVVYIRTYFYLYRKLYVGKYKNELTDISDKQTVKVVQNTFVYLTCVWFLRILPDANFDCVRNSLVKEISEWIRVTSIVGDMNWFIHPRSTNTFS